MSEEINAIFDAVGKASAYICLKDKLDSKARQLYSVQEHRCGNCWHWMKSSCKPEKQRGQFKNCNSLACQDFEISDLAGLIPRFTKELEVLVNRLAEKTV